MPPTQHGPSVGPWLQPLTLASPAAAGLSEGLHSPTKPKSLFSHAHERSLRLLLSSQFSLRTLSLAGTPHAGPSSWGGSLPVGSGSHPALLGQGSLQLGLILLWILCSDPGQSCISTLHRLAEEHCFLPLSLPVLETATTEAREEVLPHWHVEILPFFLSSCPNWCS